MTCDSVITIPDLVYIDSCGSANITNDFNDSINASGLYPVGTTTVTYTAYYASDTLTCSFDVTRNPLDDAGFSYPDSVYYITDNPQNNIPEITGQTGGRFTFSSTDLVVDSLSGEIDFSLSESGGPFMYTTLQWVFVQAQTPMTLQL